MRPASIRSNSSPFVQQKRKAGSQKLGIDMEKIDFSFNHKARDEENRDCLLTLRLQLQTAEQMGRYSKARKIRREINQLLEEGLYLTHSFCGGCLNVLHNCKC
jgi:hypothetical protein